MDSLVRRRKTNRCRVGLAILGESSVSGVATGYRNLLVEEVKEDGTRVEHTAFALSGCILEAPIEPTDVDHNGRCAGVDYVRLLLPLKTVGPLWHPLRGGSPASPFRKAKPTDDGFLSVWANWGVDGLPGAVVSTRCVPPRAPTPGAHTASAPEEAQEDVAAASNTLAGLTLGAAAAGGSTNSAATDGGDPPRPRRRRSSGGPRSARPR
eukprot:TRINITY_DN2387_c0_g1_i5.p2 TRINITY_DN2387_c0_g1~~TRINITY_DN2387_c0_g1_i5.p2  ORF type:complete len:209 (-),score=40.91 TRINITY_DN2387_c0_g1_i5:807-1433(-)